MPKINIVKFREDVRKAKNDLHVTQKQLAKAAGVGHTTLSKLVNKKLKYLTHKSVTGLCSALGLDAADYYVDPMPEPQREDVAKSYAEAKNTLARANSMLDDVQEKIDELTAAGLKVKSPDEGVEPDAAVPGQGMTHEQQIEELLAAINHVNESLNRVTIERDAATREQKETELEFINAKNKIAELKNALDIKNRSIAEKSRLVDSLTADLRADDELILALLDFIQRLKDGDVER